jgi:RHS repeat-associated protein
VTTRYLIDENGWLSQVLAELSADGTLKTLYTRGDDLISLSRGGVTRYYFFDGHGSVRLLADQTGTVTDTYTYDAFGNLTNRTGDTENDFLYAGEQFDAATGLYYLRARYMNPATGTFISMDVYAGSVFDPVSLHKYLYANANPVMFSDPSGYDGTMVGGFQALALQGALLALGTPCFMGLLKTTVLVVDIFLTRVIINQLISILVDGGVVPWDRGLGGIPEWLQHVILTDVAGALKTLVEAQIKIEVDLKNLKNNTVYVLLDGDKVMYVGRTSRPEARKKEHERNEERQNWTFHPVKTGLTPNQARVMEQALIHAYSLPLLKSVPGGNQIRGIAEKAMKTFMGEAIKHESSLYQKLQLGFLEDEFYEFIGYKKGG